MSDKKNSLFFYFAYLVNVFYCTLVKWQFTGVSHNHFNKKNVFRVIMLEYKGLSIMKHLKIILLYYFVVSSHNVRIINKNILSYNLSITIYLHFKSMRFYR